MRDLDRRRAGGGGREGDRELPEEEGADGPAQIPKHLQNHALRAGTGEHADDHPADLQEAERFRGAGVMGVFMWGRCGLSILKASTRMIKDKKKKKLVEKQMEAEEEQANDQTVIRPSDEGPSIKSQDWPLLLRNYHKMNVLTSHYTPIPAGSTPPQKAPQGVSQIRSHQPRQTLQPQFP